jgi:predicted XRE-type DNA-binding protein
MKNANRNASPGHITTGDIFDDLGASPAEALEAKIKADIWQALISCIEQRKITQTELAGILKVHQPDVSNLLRGKLAKVSVTRLIQFAARLNLDARIQISALKPARRIPSIKPNAASTSHSKAVRRLQAT